MANFASSYIATQATSVTRNPDILTYPSAGNAIASLGSASVEWTPEATMPVSVVSGYGNNYLIDMGTQQNSIERSNGAVVIDAKGAAVTSTPAWTTAAQGTRYKAASIYGTTAKGCLSGVVGTGVAVTGNTIGTNIVVGGTGAGSTVQANGNIRNVRVWTSALTDTQLQAITS